MNEPIPVLEEGFINNPIYSDTLATLLETAIQQKRMVFNAEFVGSDLEPLLNTNLISELEDGRLEFNTNSRYFQLTVLKNAEIRMNQAVPDNISAAIQFGRDYNLDIRQPTPNTHWFGGLQTILERFLIEYCAFTQSINLVDYLIALPNEDVDRDDLHFHFENEFVQVAPYLIDDSADLVRAYNHLNLNEHFESYANSLVSNFARIKPDLTEIAYQEFKANSDYAGMSSALSALYRINPETYLTEILELMNESVARGLHTAAFTEYQTVEEVNTVIDHVQTLAFDSTDSLLRAARFFVRLLKLDILDAPTVTRIFNSLHSLAAIKPPDENYRPGLVNHCRFISGYSEEKLTLLHHFAHWGDMNVFRNFFAYFDHPEYIFRTIGDLFRYSGVRNSIELFSNDLSFWQSKAPEEFSSLVLQLMVDGTPSVRYAGFLIMARTGVSVPLNLLELDEQEQRRVVETARFTLFGAPDLIDWIIVLADSEHDSVREELVTTLHSLVDGYHRTAIGKLEALLPNLSAQASGLVNEILEEFEELRLLEQSKDAIKEFNPFHNRNLLFQKYWRLDHEKSAEMMQEAQQGSTMFGLVNTSIIVRGMWFKPAQGDISPLGDMSASYPLDRRMYRDYAQFDQERTNYFTHEDPPQE